MEYHFHLSPLWTQFSGIQQMLHRKSFSETWCGVVLELNNGHISQERSSLYPCTTFRYILLCENRLSNTFFCGNNTPTHLNFLYFEVWLPYKVYLEYWVMINGHNTFQQSKIVPKLVFQGCRTQRIVENYKLYYTTWK